MFIIIYQEKIDLSTCYIKVMFNSLIEFYIGFISWIYKWDVYCLCKNKQKGIWCRVTDTILANIRWKPKVVMMLASSPLAAPKDNSGAASDNKVGIMTALGFQSETHTLITIISTHIAINKSDHSQADLTQTKRPNTITLPPSLNKSSVIQTCLLFESLLAMSRTNPQSPSFGNPQAGLFTELRWHQWHLVFELARPHSGIQADRQLLLCQLFRQWWRYRLSWRQSV